MKATIWRKKNEEGDAIFIRIAFPDVRRRSANISRCVFCLLPRSTDHTLNTDSIAQAWAGNTLAVRSLFARLTGRRSTDRKEGAAIEKRQKPPSGVHRDLPRVDHGERQAGPPAARKKGLAIDRANPA